MYISAASQAGAGSGQFKATCEVEVPALGGLRRVDVLSVNPASWLGSSFHAQVVWAIRGGDTIFSR
jgi:hypothetical protein